MANVHTLFGRQNESFLTGQKFEVVGGQILKDGPSFLCRDTAATIAADFVSATATG